MERIENKNICAACGGYCCKKCGCDYYVSDLESTKIEYLESMLDTGRVSIVAALDFNRLSNDKLTVIPFLYLRSRNLNRGEIDLLSFKTTCASLEENGCYYDLNNRPGGGASLIPQEKMRCYPSTNPIEELKKWEPYQKILGRIVKRRTGLSVYAKLKEDVINLFVDLLSGKTDGVMQEELDDVIGMYPLLYEVYHDEYLEALERIKQNKRVLQKNHTSK